MATFLWKEAVDWALGEWKVGRSPGTLDFRQHLTDLPRADWPLHAHSTEAAAHDLHESIATFRTSKRNGMDVRPPWREKSFGGLPAWMWVDSGIRAPATFVREDMFDGSEGEHDEAECRVGGVEAVGAVDDEADSPVEALVAGIRTSRRLHPNPRI